MFTKSPTLPTEVLTDISGVMLNGKVTPGEVSVEKLYDPPAWEGIVKVPLKLPSEATFELATKVMTLGLPIWKVMFIGPGVYPAPVITTDLPGGPKAGFTDKVAAIAGIAVIVIPRTERITASEIANSILLRFIFSPLYS
jgi:hypothetical protein